MKGFLVTVTFKDKSKEGVFFTRYADAEYAAYGTQSTIGVSTLADEFREIYGDEDLPIELTEVKQ